MKAIIKVMTVQKEFRQDQIAIMRRITMVLIEHDLTAAIFIKQSKKLQLEGKRDKLTKVFTMNYKKIG